VIDQPLLLVAVLCGCVIASQWLVDRTWLRHAGTAMLVIVVTAVVANLGLIPTASTPQRPVPIYDGIFEWVAPMAIFWLVLRVDLRKVLSAGGPMLLMFAVGAIGTTLGVVVARSAVGPDAFGDASAALAGMFTGTYIGGSANFNAIALHYDVMREGPLYVAAVAVDAGMTAVWMVVTIVVPRVWKARAVPSAASDLASIAGAAEPGDPDRASVDPTELAILLAGATAALWLSNAAAEALASRGWAVPSMLILTTLALGLAQIPAVARLRGANLLGMFAVYLFLAVIGAFCDVAAVGELGRLGGTLLAFVSVCLLVHGLVTFGFAWITRADPDVAAIASQANIGGGTTALALARGLGRPELVLPAILVGSLGTAAGTFVGFLVAGQFV
jgi:uncharacterized membrane protein